MNDFISSATSGNWKRLNTDSSLRLQKRANKRKSEKKIIPLEYFSDSKNITDLNALIDRINLENWSIDSVIYSLCINMLKNANLTEKNHVKKVIENYDFEIIPKLLEYKIPDNERDFLGLVYQSLLTEGEKNIQGSYYTPQKITDNMVSDFDFSSGEKYFDPCCGSGSFILSLKAENPEQIFGIDKDFIAVLIAKVNLLLKYNEKIFEPRIICADYLNNLKNDYSEILFDYVASNPPWGAKIKSGETFSYFFVKSFEQLKSNGIIRFLFPESILRVKTHRNIRKFFLESGSIESITSYEGNFTGVMTRYVSISLSKKSQNKNFIYKSNDSEQIINISSIYKYGTENLIFNFLNSYDLKIFELFNSKGKYSLKNSVWALGIVTGDNKKKLLKEFSEGSEEIFTGREITPYLLRPAKNYIFYDRKNFQQIANDEIYRAPEKLVYKFISNKLVFAYDNRQKLFLNSANILIPNIPGMSTKTVMAFLNSELYQFIYKKIFGEVKILQGNLTELLFPEIERSEDKIISVLVNEILKNENINEIHSKIQDIIYEIFGITNKQKIYIRKILS